MYSNVCESMEIDSLGGNIYFVSFIDDASWKTWVYLKCTKKKSGIPVFSTISCHGRETRNPLKLLRIDNGG